MSEQKPSSIVDFLAAAFPEYRGAAASRRAELETKQQATKAAETQTTQTQETDADREKREAKEREAARDAQIATATEQLATAKRELELFNAGYQAGRKGR